MNVLDVLKDSRNYWAVNWKLVKYVNKWIYADTDDSEEKKRRSNRGLEVAVILAYLCSQQNLREMRHELTDEGYFYCTIKKMIEDTSIESRHQRDAIKILEEFGLLSVKTRKRNGSDCTTIRYFRVEAENLSDFLEAL